MVIKCLFYVNSMNQEYNKIEAVANTIFNTLEHACCDNCRRPVHIGDDNCYSCDMKSAMWAVSKQECRKIAVKILERIEKT